jgi:hypothetical protein
MTTPAREEAEQRESREGPQSRRRRRPRARAGNEATRRRIVLARGAVGRDRGGTVRRRGRIGRGARGLARRCRVGSRCGRRRGGGVGDVGRRVAGLERHVEHVESGAGVADQLGRGGHILALWDLHQHGRHHRLDVGQMPGGGVDPTADAAVEQPNLVGAIVGLDSLRRRRERGGVHVLFRRELRGIAGHRRHVEELGELPRGERVRRRQATQDGRRRNLRRALRQRARAVLELGVVATREIDPVGVNFVRRAVQQRARGLPREGVRTRANGATKVVASPVGVQRERERARVSGWTADVDVDVGGCPRVRRVVAPPSDRRRIRTIQIAGRQRVAPQTAVGDAGRLRATIGALAVLPHDGVPVAALAARLHFEALQTIEAVRPGLVRVDVRRFLLVDERVAVHHVQLCVVVRVAAFHVIDRGDVSVGVRARGRVDHEVVRLRHHAAEIVAIPQVGIGPDDVADPVHAGAEVRARADVARLVPRGFERHAKPIFVERLCPDDALAIAVAVPVTDGHDRLRDLTDGDLGRGPAAVGGAREEGSGHQPEPSAGDRAQRGARERGHELPSRLRARRRGCKARKWLFSYLSGSVPSRKRQPRACCLPRRSGAEARAGRPTKVATTLSRAAASGPRHPPKCRGNRRHPGPRRRVHWARVPAGRAPIGRTERSVTRRRSGPSRRWRSHP